MKRSVEGVVRFMRSEQSADREGCVCCPDGVHVFARGVDLDQYEGEWPYSREGGSSPGDFVHDMVREAGPEAEGKRVRITFEVLP